ncbi:hypothetical protein RRG08_021790 [Elysia crispata]|uniref:Uncharacterized protein n=1 Tax=Elysia crispata TaxID=231223 RepID=A0AAE0ZY26_9GAST|nr:hypothetical protein RRG08_021790 [Elysia crispata]
MQSARLGRPCGVCPCGLCVCLQTSLPLRSRRECEMPVDDWLPCSGCQVRKQNSGGGNSPKAETLRLAGGARNGRENFPAYKTGTPYAYRLGAAAFQIAAIMGNVTQKLKT